MEHGFLWKSWNIMQREMTRFYLYLCGAIHEARCALKTLLVQHQNLWAFSWFYTCLMSFFYFSRTSSITEPIGCWCLKFWNSFEESFWSHIMALPPKIWILEIIIRSMKKQSWQGTWSQNFCAHDIYYGLQIIVCYLYPVFLLVLLFFYFNDWAIKQQ